MMRKRGAEGGALVELAVLLPPLLALLLGGAQVGALMYGSITVATAAREGALVGAQQPNNSGAFSNGAPAGTPYPNCPSSGSINPVCVAVWNSSGLLDGKSFVVSISPVAEAPPPWGCPVTTPSSVPDGYVKVSVSFNVPIFTPFVGTLLANPGKSYRTVTSAVSQRVFRCTMTNGG
jgi:Flp pilus assembly protein TadG